MELKICDKVKIKKWEDIDKSLYKKRGIDDYDIGECKEFINNFQSSTEYKIVDIINTTDDSDTDFEIISKDGKSEEVYSFEIEKYISVELPKELFKM